MGTSSQHKCRMTRRGSLQLPPRLDIPIPPTLLQSPYVNSLEALSQRSLSVGARPSAEDERWLQDTVPITPTVEPPDDDAKSGQLPPSPSISSYSRSPQRSISGANSPRESAHSPDLRPPPLPLDVPHSPPIVLCRRQTISRPSLDKRPHPSVHSSPCFAIHI